MRERSARGLGYKIYYTDRDRWIEYREQVEQTFEGDIGYTEQMTPFDVK